MDDQMLFLKLRNFPPLTAENLKLESGKRKAESGNSECSNLKR